jgi:hypothetical protein
MMVLKRGWLALLAKLRPAPRYRLVDRDSGKPVMPFDERTTSRGKKGCVVYVEGSDAHALVTMNFGGGRGPIGVFAECRPDTIRCRWERIG